MRVVATEDFKTYYGMVSIRASKDQEFTGAFAEYLANGRAPVRVLEDTRPKQSSEPKPAPEPEVTDESPEDDDSEAPGAEATAADVLAWVGEDPDRAAQALEAEQAREKPRSTLVKQLQKTAAQGE